MPSLVSHPAWLWLIDEAIPHQVKQRYSPQSQWKEKPFGQKDGLFFGKGIQELSSLFTERNSPKLISYLQHPKFRSSYLLYFFPLQAAKFLHLFEQYPEALEACLAHAEAQGKLTLVDFGSGPGTASLSFLIFLLSLHGRKILPIELYWFDTDLHILQEGELLLQAFVQKFPQLQGKIQLHSQTLPWLETARVLPQQSSLAFFGNVLNENQKNQAQKMTAFFTPQRFQSFAGGGVLFVEPADFYASQNLSQLRDQLIEGGSIQSLWGPCLHLLRCPLNSGKNWCHFSSPLKIPGRWFSFFSKMLGSERAWSKYSYLWVRDSSLPPLPQLDPFLRRAVSDVIPTTQGKVVLLCEPEEVYRWKTQKKVYRGDLVQVLNRKTLSVLKPK